MALIPIPQVMSWNHDIATLMAPLIFPVSNFQVPFNSSFLTYPFSTSHLLVSSSRLLSLSLSFSLCWLAVFFLKNDFPMNGKVARGLGDMEIWELGWGARSGNLR